ncbi:MAG: hypothetical protein EOO46_16990 [Flavobacterium sp.]|nr:MAG: hypothetical protein EOO46_16990 [Flavobacterium sp.]
MYSKFTNEELIEAYSTMIDYSGKADDNILKEIDKRGGLEKFLQEIEQKHVNKVESDRVLNELIKLNKEGLSLEEIKTNISSEIWIKHHLNAFIENRYIKHQLCLNDKSIDKDLILKSAIGLLLASIAGTGILLLFVFVFKFVHFGLLVPIYFVSYLIIKGYTGKSHNNGIVFLAGLIATIISGISIFLILNR